MMGSFQQNLDYDLLNPSVEETEKRVKELTSESSKFEAFSTRSRNLDDDKCKQIKIIAAKLFAGVRLLFVKYVRAKFNAFFLNPMFEFISIEILLVLQNWIPSSLNISNPWRTIN
jgi:hypothetical protein